MCLLLVLLSSPAARAQTPLPGVLERKATVQVVFETTPEGAVVSLLDMQKEIVGQSGRPVLLSFPEGRDRPLHFRFHLDGYEDHDFEVSTAALRGNGPVHLPVEGQVRLLPLTPWVPLRLFVLRHPLVVAGSALEAIVLAAMGRRLLRRYARLRRLGIPARDKDPNIGKTLAGWLLVRRLGVGGAATVYEAVSADTLDPLQPVAVKLVHPAVATAEYRGRFSREVKIGLSLDHRAIVRILDWSDAEPFCIVMELVRGEPLSRIIPQGEGMAVGRAEPILREIFGAVAYAHRRGIIHNDLKPGNVMVTPDGDVRVMDFGIASGASLTRLTATGDALGTPGYMAPEQYDGVRSQPASDQYALGCIAFEMLAGRPPFDDADLMVRMASHMKKPPPRLSTFRPDVPPAVSDAVDRMLAKRAEDRFPSVEAAWEALSASLTAPST